MKPFASLAAAVTLGIFLPACGGFTPSSSTAAVTAKSPQIDHLKLIVTPSEDDPQTPLRCGDGIDPDWCAPANGPGWKRRSFTIEDENAPYAVYLANPTDQTQETTIEITLDGVLAARHVEQLKPGETKRVARIFSGTTRLN